MLKGLIERCVTNGWISIYLSRLMMREKQQPNGCGVTTTNGLTWQTEVLPRYKN